jgi:predicted XRE-type DNA-binding protein
MLERKLRLVESEAERRGRMASDEPGEMVFTSQLAYVEAMQARVRKATVNTGSEAQRVKQKDIASQGEMSTSTVGNMASGKTHYPRFSTMFGIAAALGVEVILRPRRRS